MEVGGGSQYRTPSVYRRRKTPGVSVYRRPSRGRAPVRSWVRSRYVQNIPRIIRRKSSGGKKLQIHDEPMRDVSFTSGGLSRLLNGIPTGSKRADRWTDKIVVKGIKLTGNVQLGEDAKDDDVVHHVIMFIISDNTPGGDVVSPTKVFTGVGEGNPETWIIDPDQTDRFRLLKKMKFKLMGGKEKDQPRMGIEVVDRFCPVNVWTDYKETLIGNVGNIQKGAIYLVAASVSGKECKYTLRSQIYFKSIYL